MTFLRRRNPHALTAVDNFLDNMRLDAAAMRAPTPSPRLAATLDGRRPLRNATDPILVPPRAPRRFLDYRPFRPVAVAVATSAVLFGGLASAGALPQPVQHASAQLTSHVGIHLPGFVAPHSAPTGPVTAGSGATGTPAPKGKQSPPSTGTTTTSQPGKPPTPTTKPVAVTPVVPTLPTTPTLPAPHPTNPLPVTLPSLPLTLPSLPPVSVPVKLPR